MTLAYGTFYMRLESSRRLGPVERAAGPLLSHISGASLCQRRSCGGGRRDVNMSREESLRLNPVQQHQQHLTVETSSVRRGRPGSRRSSWINADDIERRSTSSLRVDVDGVDNHVRTHSIGKKPSGLSLRSAWRLKYQDFIPDISLTLKSEPFQ